MFGTFFMGVGLGVLFGLKHIKKKNVVNKAFVCGHCESEDTLKIQKLREKDVFTCSFCERVVDEDVLRFTHKDDYQMLKKHPEHYEEFKKARKEGRKFEVPGGTDTENS